MEQQIAYTLAYWVSFYYVILGVYLIWVAEVKAIPYGLGYSWLGAGIFLILLRPDWLFPDVGVFWFICLTLVGLQVVGILSAQAIWRAKHLKPPARRLRELIVRYR